VGRKRPDFAGLAKTFKNVFEDVAKITIVEQLFEKDSAFYQWRRTINDAIRSVRDVSASTPMQRYHDQNVGVDYVTNLRTKSPLNFWLIQNLDIHPNNHHQLGPPVIPPSTIHKSQLAHKSETNEEIHGISLF
jgi:hypothetical protein